MDAIDWNNKGIQYHNKRRYDEANDAYDRAIELDPDNPSYIQTVYGVGYRLVGENK